MARVVAPGGMVSAYVWDVLDGGFPLEPLLAGMREMGLKAGLPPRPDAFRMSALRSLWTDAGLEAIETREIVVQRTVANFDEYWTLALLRQDSTVEALTPSEREQLRTRVRAQLPAAAADGRVTWASRANAIKGRVPA